MRWIQFDNIETIQIHLQLLIYGSQILGWRIKYLTKWQQSVESFFDLGFNSLSIISQNIWRCIYSYIKVYITPITNFFSKNIQPPYLLQKSICESMGFLFVFFIIVGYVEIFQLGGFWSTVSFSATNSQMWFLISQMKVLGMSMMVYCRIVEE